MGNILDIKDDGLRTTLFNWDAKIKERKAKKNWQPPRRVRDPKEHYRGHSHNQIEEANILKKKKSNERED